MENKLKVIGKPMIKLDAKKRTIGKAIYGQDIMLPGMLYGGILRTKHPVAKILSINTDKAKALTGVKTVITADDVNVNLTSYRRDHPILKKGRVNCIRDEIAAVAATSPEILAEALDLIEVDYDIEEGIYDPFEALKEETRQINDYIDGTQKNKNISAKFHYDHGDLELLKKESAVIVNRRYTLPFVTHCCMGTTSVTADYLQADGTLTLHSATQVPFLFQRDLAHAVKMEPSKIRIMQPVIGGGFGSKLDMHPFEPICVLLSMKSGQPVQLTYNREEEFLASPTRQPMVIDLSTGVDKEGKFTFRDVNITMDNGAYTSWGSTTPFVMMQAYSSLYQVEACNFDAAAVYTNNPYSGSFRGYGNPQATFSIERNIDLMAKELGMSSDEMRLKNANFKGEITGQELEYKTCGHPDALKLVIDKSSYTQKREQKESGRYRKGIGIASMLHVGGGAKIYRSDGCGTTVKLDDYGYLTIITGSTEIGQGSETVLAMIAAEELGIEMQKIKVINTDSDVKPWDVGVHASRTSFVAGNSLLGAMKILKEKLIVQAKKDMGTGDEALEFVEGSIQSSSGKVIKIDKLVRNMHFKGNELCSASYFYEPPSKFADKDFKGDISGNYAFAAQTIEVEVDTYTGNVKVLDIHMSQDVGRVLNPLGLDGQIHGGIATGIGYALTEELKIVDGRVLNPNFHDYKMLTACDMPNIEFHPVESLDEAGPYGSKGVGEAPLIPTAAAIANAVSNALDIEITSLPITPENVLRAIQEQTK